MTTIINTPGNTNKDDSSSVAMVLVVIIALALGGAFLYYTLPNADETKETNTPDMEINVQVPTKEEILPQANTETTVSE